MVDWLYPILSKLYGAHLLALTVSPRKMKHLRTESTPFESTYIVVVCSFLACVDWIIDGARSAHVYI